jgi:hypothetical protein
VLDADRATALVMVITELVQNAIEHAFDPSATAGFGGDPVGALGALARRHRPRRPRMPEGFSLEKSDRLGCRSFGRWLRPSSMVRWECTPPRAAGMDVMLRVPIGRRANTRVPQ